MSVPRADLEKDLDLSLSKSTSEPNFSCVHNTTEATSLRRHYLVLPPPLPPAFLFHVRASVVEPDSFESACAALLRASSRHRQNTPWLRGSTTLVREGMVLEQIFPFQEYSGSGSALKMQNMWIHITALRISWYVENQNMNS